MNNTNLDRTIRDKLIAYRRRRVWKRIVALMAAFVVVFISFEMSYPAAAVTDDNSPVIEEQYVEDILTETSGETDLLQTIAFAEQEDSCIAVEEPEDSYIAQEETQGEAYEEELREAQGEAPVEELEDTQRDIFREVQEEELAEEQGAEFGAAQEEVFADAQEEVIAAEQDEVLEEVQRKIIGEEQEEVQQDMVPAGDREWNQEIDEVIEFVFSEDAADLSGWISSVELETSLPVEKDEEGNILTWSDWEKAESVDGVTQIRQDETLRFTLQYFILPDALVQYEETVEDTYEEQQSSVTTITSYGAVTYTLPESLAEAVSEFGEVEITLLDYEVEANILEHQYVDGVIEFEVTAGDILQPGEEKEIIFRDDFIDGIENIVSLTLRCAEEAAAGIPEVELSIATVMPADGSLLPEDLTGDAYIEEGDAAELAAADVKAYKDNLLTDDSEEADDIIEEYEGIEEYKSFNISLAMSDEELEEYTEGFSVTVTLPEMITGRDFHLYQLTDMDGVQEITELSLECHTAEDSFDAVQENEDQTITGFTFVTHSFGQFVLSYTADFHWEANGKIYEFKLPESGFVSFAELTEVLGIAEGEDIKNFTAAVENVEFSSPELVDVSRAEEDTTVGQIIESRGLEIQYPAEMTEEQIGEINSRTVTAGDWAIIGLLSFESEELLTVTMKNGDVFTVRVTDEQIKKSVMKAESDSWEITVTYGSDAQIPDGARLEVREILAENERYEEYYQESIAKAGEDTADDTSRDAAIGQHARIFDIEIWAEDQKIEPAAQVTVNIRILDIPVPTQPDSQVVHFAEKGTELMELKEKAENSEAEGVQFVTDGFSVYSVVYTVDFSYDGYAFSIGGGDAISLRDLAGKLHLDDDTDKLIANVVKVEFSNPELVWVGKTEEDTTNAGLLSKNDLQPVYREGITANEYGECLAKEFSAGEWVLISLQPFSSEEVLTITMNSGVKYLICVTDDADAVLIPDGQGGQIVQTIANPSGTTIDLFDYWISDSLRNATRMNGWPGYKGSGWSFQDYDYNGRRLSNNDPPMSQDTTRKESQWYVQNGHLRGNGNNQGINSGHVFKFYPGAAGTVVDYGRKGSHTDWTNNHDEYSSINSWTGTADPTTGLVQGTLNAEGYPQLTNSSVKGTDGSSLSYLFDDSGHSGKQKYGNVDNLLYVDSDGYYTYDSRYYSATYSNGGFVLRQFDDSIAADSPERGFWPFGDRVNWHGMHMTTNFSMPANGQVLNPNGVYKDMQFEFSGDDDTWLYLDGILVGDGGGIHNRTEIDINFATGIVTVKGTADPNHPGSYVWTSTLKDIYTAAGRAGLYEWDGNTFKSGTYHKFEMFYLERGGSESNLYIHYNLVSTTDFSAHKSYHSEDGSRLMRDQFQFELIGFDNTAYTNGFVPAIMPTGGSAGGAGTVASPRLTRSSAAPAGIELPADLTTHTSLITGVTEDGNVNFGNIQIQASQAGFEYKYIVREVVPNDAVNADNIRWDEASDEVKSEGGFTKDGITYDGKVYYFIGRVQEVLNDNGTGTGSYELKKYRYTDANYSVPDTQTKFFSFVNGYVRPITLKVIKKSNSGKLLGGAEFSLTRAMKSADDRWIVREYLHDGQILQSTPKTGTTSEGELLFDNLTEGHYILEETNAPAGYEKNSTYRWLLTLTKQDAADRIVLVPVIQALDENGYPAGEAAELVLDGNNVIEHEVLNSRIPQGDITVEKIWLKLDGVTQYTDAELEELGVDGTKVTGELWRRGESAAAAVHPTVTIFAKLNNQSDYQLKWQGQIEYGSDISYSMAVNGTGFPITTIVSTGAEAVHAADQDITYDNGIQKTSGHVFALQNVTQDTQIYAEFDSSKANSKGIGFKLVSKTDPVTATAIQATEEKFADFTLEKGSWSKTWTSAELYGAGQDEEWTYFFKNVAETPESEGFEFTEDPEVSVEGTTTVYTYKNICMKASVRILKVIKDTEVPLAGAEFTLTQIDDNRHVMKDESGQPIAQVKTTAETTGEITFDGLTTGMWYKLAETGTPAGYITTEGPYYLYIDENGFGTLDTTVEYTMISPESGNVYTVENEPGAVLPNTGGSGTETMYRIGFLMILAAGAGIMLIRQERSVVLLKNRQ